VRLHVRDLPKDVVFEHRNASNIPGQGATGTLEELTLEPRYSAQLSVLPLSSPAELQYTDLAPHSQRAPLQVARVRITGQTLGFLVFTYCEASGAFAPRKGVG
jgi:hypothetical protein